MPFYERSQSAERASQANMGKFYDTNAPRITLNDNQVKYSVTLDKVIDKGEIERMRSFSEQLRLLLQSPDKVEDQIGAILMMIDVQIIGNYEPTPRMSKTQDVEAWIKQDDYFSTRNALRKEQRAQLGPEWHERHIAMQGEIE